MYYRDSVFVNQSKEVMIVITISCVLYVDFVPFRGEIIC